MYIYMCVCVCACVCLCIYMREPNFYLENFLLIIVTYRADKKNHVCQVCNPLAHVTSYEWLPQ